MLALIDHYANRSTWLHNWHPTVRVLSLLVAIFVCTWLKRPGPLLIMLLTANILAASAAVPARLLYRRYRTAILISAAVFLAAWLFLGHGPTWRIGPASVPVYALRPAVILALKLSAILLLTVPLLATQPFHVLIASLRRIGLPRKLVNVFLLMQRYNMVLADEFQNTATAATLRGFRWSANPRRLKGLGGVVGALLVRSVERAERVEQAMRLRGFAGELTVSWPWRLQVRDLLKAAAVSLPTVLAILLELRP